MTAAAGEPEFPPECAGFREGPGFRLAAVHGGYAFKAPGPVDGLALGPGDATLYTLSAEILAWDLATGAVRASFDPGGQALSACASPDGRRLLVGRNDGRLVLLDVATGAPVWEVFAASLPGGPVPRIRSVALSPDGRLAASYAETEDAVRLFHDGRPVATLPGSDPVTFSPDGALLWVKSTLHDVRRGAPVFQLPEAPRGGDRSTAADFSPDGRVLALGTADGRLMVLDLGTCQPRWSVSMPLDWRKRPAAPTTVRFAADGRTLVTTAFGYQVWDAATGEKLREGSFPASKEIFAASRGQLLGVSGVALRQLDVTTGALSPLSGHLDAVRAISFSPRGPTVISGGDDRRLLLFRLGTPEPLRELSHQGKVVAAAFLTDGRRVAALSDERLRVWDLATSTVVAELTELSARTSGLRSGTDLSAAPDAASVLVCNEDGVLRRWSVESKADLWAAPLDVRFASFTPGAEAIVATTVRAVLEIDPATGACLRETAFVDGVRITRALVLGRGSSVVRVQSGKGLWILPLGPGTPAFVEGSADVLAILAVSPDGRHAATTTADRPDAIRPAPCSALTIFDLATRTRAGRIDLASSHDHPTSAGFSPDGRTLVVGTARGVVLELSLTAPYRALVS